MRLSILDQIPLTEHAPTAGQAMSSGLQLAEDAEALGYHRIWFAEHHHSKSFASAAPEMMTALALERTETIRVGTGAILLPYYQAQKVSEAMGLLAAVHSDRVDIGVGRDKPQAEEQCRAGNDAGALLQQLSGELLWHILH
ncbi:LLM class flavin-dependent oxidoreductase [Glutamicibacter sp. NPDC055491]